MCKYRHDVDSYSNRFLNLNVNLKNKKKLFCNQHHKTLISIICCIRVFKKSTKGIIGLSYDQVVLFKTFRDTTQVCAG